MSSSSSIQVVNDANGTAHAFLADNGNLWQCQWNAQAQRWDRAQVVPGAVGGEKMQALYLDNLWPTGNGSSPGIVLAYRVGEGSSAEIYASLGQWGSDGQLFWQTPVPLTDDQVEDQAFALTQGTDGGFSLVVQKQEAATTASVLLEQLSSTPADQLEASLQAAASADRPDSDLYSSQFAIGYDNQSGLNTFSNLTAGTSTSLTAAPSPIATANAPLAFSGNTQLSRQQLIIPPTQAAQTQTLASSPMLGLAAPAAASPSGVSWQGGAAGQVSTNKGGTLRFGLLLGQNLLRWGIEIGNHKGENLDAGSDVLSSRSGSIYSSSSSSFLSDTGVDLGGSFLGDASGFESFVNESRGSFSEILNPPPSGLADDFSTLTRPRSYTLAAAGLSPMASGSASPLGHSGTAKKETTAGWFGVIALANVGSGGPAVLSTARLYIERGNNERRGLFESGLAQKGGLGLPGWTKVQSGNALGGGGDVSTVYQYQGKGKPRLVSLQSDESIGLDWSHTSLSFSETGGSLLLDTVVSAGWIFSQELNSAEGEQLPSWLAYLGYLGGAAADVEKTALGGAGGLLRGSGYSAGRGLNTWSDLLGGDQQSDRLKRLQWVNAGVGASLAALGPATSIAAASGGLLSPDAEFGHSSGLNLYTRLTGRWLYKSVLGVQLTLANSLTRYLVGDAKGLGTDQFYVSAGLALPLGGSVPLFSDYGSTSWQGITPFSSSSSAPQGLAAPSASDSANSPTGGFIGASSGSSYPFLYAPQSGSTSFLTSPNSASQNNSASPLLAGQTTDLKLITLLPTAVGAINPDNTAGDYALTLYNPGSGLVDGSYTDVPILGVTADGDPQTAAKASFTVAAGSIVASSFQIASQGAYVGLPETQPGNGIYALVLDVYSTGIAIPPAPGSGSLSNFLSDLPLITLTNSPSLDPPLTIQTILRIDGVPVNAKDQPAIYPKYDPSTQTTTAPAADQNGSYSYSNVPVQLFSAATSAVIPLLNPGAAGANPPNSVTATVTISGGVIQRVAIDQPLLLSNTTLQGSTSAFKGYIQGTKLTVTSTGHSFAVGDLILGNSVAADTLITAINSDGTYSLSRSQTVGSALYPANLGTTALTVQLSLPEAVVNSLPQGTPPPTFGVIPEAIAFNNFVADEQFSAQPDTVNSGVFLSAGLSDQLLLTSAMATWPRQNRVTYVTPDSVVYLNASSGSTATAEVDPSQLTLKDLYNGELKNTNPVFSAASTPTAITIAGTGSGTGGNYARSTFVAWVEASDPVIPNTTAGDGFSNFQAFMEALYGNQRINFRINQGGTWKSPSLKALYSPDNAVIRHLQSFNVPNADAPGGMATLVVWDETSIDAIKDSGFEGWIDGTTLTITSPGVTLSVGAQIRGIHVVDATVVTAINGDGTYTLSTSQTLGSQQDTVVLMASDGPPTVLKAGWINPNPTGSYQWDALFTDANGNSTIQTIPWDQAADVGLTINDISIASQPRLLADGSVIQSPLITWSQEVRTPYRQTVLKDQPSLYLQFDQLQSGISDINLGSVNSNYTSTFASSTGLNFTIPGALSKSQATAVQNLDGTGVLSTGLGTTFSALRQLASNVPSDSLAAGSPTARFSGSIDGTTLTVSVRTAGQLGVNDVLSGPGVLPGTTITASNQDGTFTVNNSQSVGLTSLQAIEALPQLPLSSFMGSISGNTLSVSAISLGNLAVGDLISGPGIPEGTTIIALNTVDAQTGIGSYSLDRSLSDAVASSALVGTPGVPCTPYTIEFWAKLPDVNSEPSNPNGAGLVALGQPSDDAVGAPTLPEGWLLNASFVVDQLTNQQAVAQGLLTAIPSGETADALYGWQWGVVATGANTTAMDGNGGSNLYNNALLLDNLVSGSSLAGVTAFLANYNLTPEDLIGVDGSNAATIASVPTTQLQFTNAIGADNLPDSSLNGIAVDTSTALLNQGRVVDAQDINPNLQAMLTALWNFQQKTGEAKVNFSLAPDSTGTTTSGGALPAALSSESYSGYQLGFSLARGTAISVNGSGQLVFDIGKGASITSQASGTVPADLRDGNWHYVVASFLPTYQTYDASGVTTQLPTNMGTASLYVDNQLVASDGNVFNPYPLLNLNDQAQLLTNNDGGAIDQLAFYDKALSSAAFNPNLSGNWPTPSAEDALALVASLGYNIATKTPDPGAIPGAVTQHWDARNVNPNAAALATFTSSFDASTHSWSPASSLSPELKVDPTINSYSSSGSFQDGLVVAVPTAIWSSTNPVNKQLTQVLVGVTNLSDPDKGTATTGLIPSLVLLGNQTLADLQSQTNDSYFNYTVLSNSPQFSLVIPKELLPASTGDKLKDRYSVTYEFIFSDKTSVTATSTVDLNSSLSSLAAIQSSGSVSSANIASLQSRNTAIATAAVIEQAPLQLKYVDSGVVLKSDSTAAGATSPALSSPANSFGQSQVIGSFTDSNSNTNGWLAIAQPFSTNAFSNPSGRVWVQYAGQSKSGSPSSTAAQAPTTWLNALANSNFSPDTPNLPLLGDANNPSSTGGLLIKADATAGWGQNFGQTMLVADVNQDGTDDLIIAAPQANGGGRVVIIDGQWIKTTLTTSGGATTLDLSNPSSVGSYVTVLQAAVPSNSNDDISVANFGSSLAFDGKTLWIGAPNYLRQLLPGSTNPVASNVPIGGLYSYSTSSTNANGWDSNATTPLSSPILGTSGTTLTNGPTGSSTTTYWGSQFGTAIAVSDSGAIAVSAPGLQASMLYSGTSGVQATAQGLKSPSDSSGDGALIQIQLPSSGNNNSVSSTQGVKNPGLINVSQNGGDLSAETSTYMQNLKDLQAVPIVSATVSNNQAIQTGAVGAVYLFGSSADLSALTSPVSAETVAAASKGGATFYGPNPWNVIGASGFGSSLSFGDFNNKNTESVLAIGAPQAGGSGALYLVDTQQGFLKTPSSQPAWMQAINLSQDNQYLAHLASGLTLYGAENADNFGSGLLNLGDVNKDGYNDLLIQAYNASSGAGDGFVLFGNDQVNTTANATPNPASGSVAPGTLGQLKRADKTTLTIPILSELGYGTVGYTGQGTFGSGDINGDGYNDIPLGSGPNANAYLTWGHPYMEAIGNLQLSRLTSDSGFMLDGLATTNQGSLRSIGDFNGDGYDDFMSISPGSSNWLTTVRIELGANTEEILADSPYNYYTFTVANGTQVIPAGDMNGDGMADIALFLDQNLSSGADGNSGAGSTTGILYGRSSADLPVGAGFGFEAMVDPTTSAPMASLPGVAMEKSGGEVGLTDATASVIAVGSILYAAVKGKGDNTLWFNQSTDGGNTWANWIELTTVNSGFASNSGPSLSFFQNKLYLGFVNLSGGLSLASWDPSSNNLSAWTAPSAVSDASDPSATYRSAFSPQLLDRGDVLGMAWVDATSGTLQTSSSPTPDGAAGSWTSPSPVLQRIEGIGGASYEPISATAAPTATWLADVPVLAVNNNGSINVYSGVQGSGSLQLTSTFTAPDGGPAITSAPMLATTPTGLALTYTNADGSISLNRLSFISANGAPLPGVQFAPDGSIDTGNADLQWQSTTLNEGNSGLSTSLASTPVSVNGNLLLTNVRNGSNQQSQIWINAVPNLADATSTTWLNSTVQLSDATDGWVISQQASSSPIWSTQVGGLSPKPPAFAQADGVLYAAVQGTDNNIYWNSSSNGGSTWGSWQQVKNGNVMTTDQAPALAWVNNTLYLAYLGDGNSQINISSLTNTANNTWSSQYQIPNQGADSICMLNEGGDLVIYYQGTNSQLYRTSSSTPGSSSGWQENSIYYDNSTSDNQTASGQLAATYVNGTTYLAYQGGTASSNSNTIYLTSSSNQSSGTSWNLISGFDQPINPTHSGVGLTNNGDGLMLSYADTVANSPVLVLQQGAISNNTWTPTGAVSVASPGGTTSPQASLFTPTNAGPNQVLLASINGKSSNGITTILASPSQLLTAAQTGSTLSPVGDLNNDGFADLLVTAQNVVVSTSTGQQLATGLRVISGAGDSATITSLNDSNSTTTPQRVQLTAPFTAGSGTPVSVIAGSNPSAGTFQLSIGARNESTVASISSEVSSSALSATSSSVAEASALLGGLTPTQQTLSSANGWGDQALNGNGAYGDLNHDGYLDYFDPAGNGSISTVTGLSFSLWSIRAAGDVNGNGVDDLLLSLAPNGPAYQQVTSGEPSALQSVLVDGSLFNVDSATNSFRLDQLKTPLNPYNRSQLYDVASTSTSDYAPSLQNWFDPILSFTPGALTAASTGTSTNPGSAAESFAPPCAVVSPEGETTLFFTGADHNGSTTNASGLWMAYQDSSGNWQQMQCPAGSNANNTSPSAAYFEGQLYVAYTDVSHNIYIAVCSGSPEDSASWTSYQVETTVDESTAYSPTLIAENGRLGLYFPSNNGGAYSTTYQAVRYLYSNNPSDSGSYGNWGASLSSSTGSYSGVSGQLDSSYEVTSPIAATTFQGRTVLAFRSSASGGGFNTGDGDIILLTQVASAPTASNPGSSLSWVEYDTSVNNVNGVGLTTDQSLLYLTTAPNYKATNPGAKIWSLQPVLNTAGQADGSWTMGDGETLTGPSLWNETAIPGSTNFYNAATVYPFMDQGQLMAAWTDNNKNVQIADVSTTIGTPSQKSLAGYSLDGNIDINGDGFRDVLLSDPTDATQSVDNQYALFGGDYLNIASQVGTPGDDDIVGTPLADVIYSLAGSDGVISAGGKDVIYTGSGDDQISIADNSFIRIDAGSGFDSLQLQGLVNQSYDFSLNVSKPEYFAGTKLRDIELISSLDYGANSITLDAEAVNALNSDRIVFLTPDASDTIHLSSVFQVGSVNTPYNTTFGGYFWNAFIAEPQSSSGDSSPTVVYVLNPAGASSSDWLTSHVIIDPPKPPQATNAPSLLGASAPQTSSPITLPTAGGPISSTPFGDGLELRAYPTSPSQGYALFELHRNDASARQVISYVSSSAGSTAEAGRDYTAVAGVVVLDAGQSSQLISVPLTSDAFARLKGAQISLQVQQLPDIGQSPLDLLIQPGADKGNQDGLAPSLSGLTLTPSVDGTSLSFGFRADTTTTSKKGNRQLLDLVIGQRPSADVLEAARFQSVQLADEAIASSDRVATAKLLFSDLARDRDRVLNGQVSSDLRLRVEDGDGTGEVTMAADGRYVDVNRDRIPDAAQSRVVALSPINDGASAADYAALSVPKRLQLADVSLLPAPALNDAPVLLSASNDNPLSDPLSFKVTGLKSGAKTKVTYNLPSNYAGDLRNFDVFISTAVSPTSLDDFTEFVDAKGRALYKFFDSDKNGTLDSIRLKLRDGAATSDADGTRDGVIHASFYLAESPAPTAAAMFAPVNGIASGQRLARPLEGSTYSDDPFGIRSVDIVVDGFGADGGDDNATDANTLVLGDQAFQFSGTESFSDGSCDGGATSSLLDPFSAIGGKPDVLLDCSPEDPLSGQMSLL